jgi:nitroimidazol reductase NimA-like FMN-containing flavoprotein (pyridoxamine 5'-phosphate oxidase superfamily)
MSNKNELQLNEKLYSILQRECFLLLHTNDFEKMTPQVNAISWVYAPNKETVRFAVVNHSKIIKNITTTESICLTLIDDESTYAIYGKAKILENETNKVAIKVAIVEMEINEVRDVMFYGSKISQNPRHEKVYDPEAAAKLDYQVMQRLKNPR